MEIASHIKKGKKNIVYLSKKNNKLFWYVPISKKNVISEIIC